MRDEAADLMKTLAFTLGVIIESEGVARQRIATAYAEAQQLIQRMASETGPARSRVVACLKRFKKYERAGDPAAAGWMLTAIQQRIDERDLAKWQELKIVADKAAQILGKTRGQLH